MNSLFTVSISILSGMAFALFLYSKKTPWSIQMNILIAIFRTVAIAIIVFMVLSPFIKSKRLVSEKSSFVIAIDNSTSVADGLDKNESLLLKNIESLKEKLSDKFDVKIYNLDGSDNQPLKEMQFKKKESDISNMLNLVTNNLETNNVKGMVLISDGIINKGTSPLYVNFSYPVFAMGIGDTTVPKDVIVKNCLFNNIVGKNNRFPISVEIKANGYKGSNLNLALYSGKTKLQSKLITISDKDFSATISFESSEIVAGIKHYAIVAEPLEGEFSTKNNKKDIYFEVIEVKQKIALFATAPHPDIKALAASLSGNENVEVNIFIEGIDEFKNDKFDLIIAYQLPGYRSEFNKYIDQFVKANLPVLFIVGSAVNIAELNLLLPNFKILAQQGQFDKVTGISNPAFTRLNFNAGLSSFLESNPPLIVPFGEYNLGAGWDKVLYQKVGTIATEKPLFALYSAEGKNYGVLLGEGIWQWRINEYAENQNTIVFDDFIKKTATLLTQKTDKRKFRCYTSEKLYDENSPVLFKIETYNDIYEQVYDHEISLEIKDEKGKMLQYKFVNSASNPNFELNGLKSGVYSFTSKTVLSGKEQVVKGEFSIQNISLEDITQVADFELLRNISNKSGGQFYNFSDFEKLQNDLQQLNADQKKYRVETLAEIINFGAILWVLILLLGFEWGIRKYLGQV